MNVTETQAQPTIDGRTNPQATPLFFLGGARTPSHRHPSNFPPSVGCPVGCPGMLDNWTVPVGAFCPPASRAAIPHPRAPLQRLARCPLAIQRTSTRSSLRSPVVLRPLPMLLMARIWGYPPRNPPQTKRPPSGSLCRTFKNQKRNSVAVAEHRQYVSWWKL